MTSQVRALVIKNHNAAITKKTQAATPISTHTFPGISANKLTPTTSSTMASKVSMFELYTRNRIHAMSIPVDNSGVACFLISVVY